MSGHGKGPELEYGAECGDIREEGNNLIADLYLDGRGTVAEATARRDALGRKMAAAMELVEACQKVRARAQEAAEAMPGMTLERLLRTGDGVEIRLPVSVVAECVAALKKAGVAS